MKEWKQVQLLKRGWANYNSNNNNSGKPLKLEVETRRNSTLGMFQHLYVERESVALAIALSYL